MQLPSDVEERLRSFAALLERFAPKVGLLGPGEMAELWERHILDSLRALPCLEEADSELADLGSGGGLPGIPLAIACPDRKFRLIEPSRRRIAFLELAVQELALRNVDVMAARAEEAHVAADICLVRAFAPPVVTWNVARGLLNPRGKVLYYAGRSWNPDIQANLERAGAAVTVCVPPRSTWQGPIVSLRPTAAKGTRE
jgi:16S rRNA (guanine527-N7)-methyltransferase